MKYGGSSLLFVCVAALAACAGTARASVILGFNTFGANGELQSVPSAYNDPTVASTTLTKGAGTSTSHGIANSLQINASAAQTGTLADAVTHNVYMSFTVTPSDGGSVDLTGVIAKIFWRNSGGTFTLESSAAGFGTGLGQDLGDVTIPVTQGGSPVTHSFAFSDIVSTSPIEFRIYGYSNQSSANERGIASTSSGDYSLELDGTATSVPEPATCGLSCLAALALLRRRRHAV